MIKPARQEQEPASEEITEVAPNILWMQLPITMPGLGHVNCYALEDERGVVVVKVKTGSPAEEAGVREGDLVLEVNRKAVTSLKSYERLASSLPKDQSVLLLLRRQGRTIYLTLRP